MANLTFENDGCMHSSKEDKPNDYRSIIKMICDTYSNTLTIPMFGYSAKTNKLAPNPCDLFPLS